MDVMMTSSRLACIVFITAFFFMEPIKPMCTSSVHLCLIRTESYLFL